MKMTLNLAFSAGIAIAFTPLVWGGTEKLSSDLQPEKTTGVHRVREQHVSNVDVIVQYKVTPTEEHYRRVAGLGGHLNAKMDFIRGAHYTVPRSALETLAADPDAPASAKWWLAEYGISPTRGATRP